MQHTDDGNAVMAHEGEDHQCAWGWGPLILWGTNTMHACVRVTLTNAMNIRQNMRHRTWPAWNMCHRIASCVIALLLCIWSVSSRWNVMPCDAVWCRVMPCDAMPCDAVWFRVMPCDAVWCRVMPCDSVWCHVMPCDSVWFSVMPCDSMWCRVIPCDAVWCRVMPSDLYLQDGCHPVCLRWYWLPSSCYNDIDWWNEDCARTFHIDETSPGNGWYSAIT